MVTRKKMAGFGLVEVLIAFLILLIGLLGMAGLQATALRNNHSAYLRSQAVFMAYDIMDRMRANKVAALAGNYARSLGDPKPSQTCTLTCSTTNMALADEREWVSSLDRLPSGDGSISVNSSGVATVTVCWDDARISDSSDSGGQCNLTEFKLTTQL